MKTRNAILLAALTIAMLARPDAANAAPAVKPAELIALLKSSAPKSEKVKAFKPLAIFGNKDAVPAIAPYLADAELSSWARIALEAIPDPSCDEALRNAAATLKGRLLIGVINSIGVRRDAKAVKALVKRLGDSDQDVALAAAAALGQIGGEEAAQALEKALSSGSPAIRDEAADALVRCAEKSLAEGNKDNALRLYDLVAKADVSERRVLEAVHGAILARGPAGHGQLVELLKSADKKRFALGLKLSREIVDPEVTDALLAELGRASPGRKALLLLALADRADPKARDALLQATKGGSPEVRIASIRGLKTAGDASCGRVLLDALMDADPSVSEAALDVLADLRAKELADLSAESIDDLLAARLQAASGPGRLMLIALAGRRHVESLTPILLKLADDADVNVRAAAIAALGSTVRVSELPVLLARATCQNPMEAHAAEAALRAACGRLSDRDASTAQVLAAITGAQLPAKCKLLEFLVTIGGEKALDAVAAASKDSRAELRRAGYQALGKWTSADAGPVILALIKNGDPALKIGATRAYIRVARQFSIPAGQRMAMFREIMTLAQRDEERRLALDILKQIRTAESLSVVVGFLDQPNLSDAAARVAVAMSDKMVETMPAEVAEAMQQVLRAANNKDVVNKARALLNRTGRK
jgi:HEAT repeat protein